MNNLSNDNRKNEIKSVPIPNVSKHEIYLSTK